MADLIYKTNLNKASNRLDRFESKQKQKKYFALGFYFAVILVIGALAIYSSMQTQQKIESYEKELADIEQEIDRLEASTDYLSPKDIFALAELANTRLTWTEKFDVLGEILPKDVALIELSYDNRVNTLKIKGVSKVNPNAKDLETVVSIIDLIKGNEDFSKNFADIKFSSSTRIKHQDQEVIEFEISCLVG